MDIYIIYKITSLVNKKMYIGYTKYTIIHRLKGHIRNAKLIKNKNNKFGRALLNYGKENFVIESIFTTNDKKIALEKECYYIELYDTQKNGYNTTKGGEVGVSLSGNSHADLVVKKILFMVKNIVMNQRKKFQIIMLMFLGLVV